VDRRKRALVVAWTTSAWGLAGAIGGCLFGQFYDALPPSGAPGAGSALPGQVVIWLVAGLRRVASEPSVQLAIGFFFLMLAPYVTALELIDSAQPWARPFKTEQGFLRRKSTTRKMR
jgi:hypothetical protein